MAATDFDKGPQDRYGADDAEISHYLSAKIDKAAKNLRFARERYWSHLAQMGWVYE